MVYFLAWTFKFLLYSMKIIFCCSFKISKTYFLCARCKYFFSLSPPRKSFCPYNTCKLLFLSVVTSVFLISRLSLISSQLLPNITVIEYSAKLFDHILNSTDYDSRMRPTPRGINESVEDGMLWFFQIYFMVVQVKNSMYVYFLGNIDAEGMAFDVHFLIRL